MTAVELDLVAATARDVVHALEAKSFTTEQLVQAYLERIDELNGRLRAVIEIAPRDSLVEIAKKLDFERSQGKVRGPLHGVPILIKDTIYTDPSMGMETSAGTFVLVGSKVPGNAAFVDNMLSAGMIILGKANLTVMGNYLGDLPSGWSPRGGQCSSFIKPGGKVSGSSSGSAVAVSAGMCTASVGAETNGSISYPASVAGVFGLKPTVGVIPPGGCMILSHRVDTCGPMGKSAWDIAAVLDAMVSGASDHYTKYTGSPHNDISKYRIGILREGLPPVDDLAEGGSMRDAGLKFWDNTVSKLGDSVKVESVKVQDVEKLFSSSEGKWSDSGPTGHLLVTDVYVGLNEHFATIKDCPIKDLEGFLEWNRQHPYLAWHHPDKPDQQNLLEAVQEKKGEKDETYLAAVELSETIVRNLEEAIDRDNLDLLIFPLEVSGWSTVAASAGFPLATMPLGFLPNGDPLPFLCLAKKFEDAKLIGFMAACEALSITKH